MYKSYKTKNVGITLIALIVTIIVLLILAGISISMVTGDNGLLVNATKSKSKYEESAYYEEISLILLNARTENIETAFKNEDKDAVVTKSNAIYEVKYKGEDILIGNDLTYIEKVEPENADDWEYNINGTITKYNGNDSNIIIPNYINGKRIKSLGSSIFKDNMNIKEVQISEGIDEIGYYCFRGSSIEKVNLPNSLTKISVGGSFEICKSLEYVTFGKNLQIIGDYAFNGCTNLKGHLSLPNTLQRIGNYAFSGCKNMEGIYNTPESLTFIGSGAFYDCEKITGSIKIPKEMTEVYTNTFNKCLSLNGNLELHDDITSIGSGAFQNCTNLKGNLNLPRRLTTLGSSAFEGCKGFEGDLIIPEEVTNIGGYCFYGNGYSGILKIPNSLTSIHDSVFSSNLFTKVIVDNTEENVPKIKKASNVYYNMEYLR